MAFGACMDSIFYARQFPTNSEHMLHILGQKSKIPFFLISASFLPPGWLPKAIQYTHTLKAIPEGFMVEYLWVGSKGARQTIINQKDFRPEITNSPQSSVQWIYEDEK